MFEALTLVSNAIFLSLFSYSFIGHLCRCSLSSLPSSCFSLTLSPITLTLALIIAPAPKAENKGEKKDVGKAAPKVGAKGKAPAGGVKKAQAAKKAVAQGTKSESKAKVRTSIRFHL